jgi:hypothetical protein
VFDSTRDETGGNPRDGRPIEIRGNPMAAERYLGDGLYVSFDGFSYVLRAPRAAGDHWVALEPEVLAEFDRYRAEIEARREAKR